MTLKGKLRDPFSGKWETKIWNDTKLVTKGKSIFIGQLQPLVVALPLIRKLKNQISAVSVNAKHSSGVHAHEVRAQTQNHLTGRNETTPKNVFHPAFQGVVFLRPWSAEEEFNNPKGNSDDSWGVGERIRSCLFGPWKWNFRVFQTLASLTFLSRSCNVYSGPSVVAQAGSRTPFPQVFHPSSQALLPACHTARILTETTLPKHLSTTFPFNHHISVSNFCFLQLKRNFARN